MNLFDSLVSQAIENKPEFSSLRVVVEKELLQHDILRILKQKDMLKNLTFIGGTALRCCFGGVRLSEDLDFTGGADFTKHSLSGMSNILSKCLVEKYGLKVHISSPQKDISNVDTWKIKMETKPLHKHLPAQRINIDICAIPSYDTQPMMLINQYGIDMGTNGLIINTQSMEEIFTDKLLAFALRPNRMKYRDIWDIIWLNSKNIKPHYNLLPKKIADRKLKNNYFIDCFRNRTSELIQYQEHENGFKKEMFRFLPAKVMKETIEQENYWQFTTILFNNLKNNIEFNL